MCDSCQQITVQGLKLHEQGCPKAERECKWCGNLFEPQHGVSKNCCSHTCYITYWNIPCECDECNGDWNPIECNGDPVEWDQDSQDGG